MPLIRLRPIGNAHARIHHRHAAEAIRRNLEGVCHTRLESRTNSPRAGLLLTRLSLAFRSNVGGGDFVQMFGSDGKLQLWKELDPQLHVSGPCLSKADYTAVSLNEALSSHVTIRGSRTDDVVRVFVDIRWAAPRPRPRPAPRARARARSRNRDRARDRAQAQAQARPRTR